MTKTQIENIAKRTRLIASREANDTVGEWASIILEWIDRGRSTSFISKHPMFKSVRSVARNGNCR